VSARELMVSLWYPAEPSDGERAPYMTAAESALFLASKGADGVPGGHRRRRLPARARSLDITRAYVLAFFDQHLRGEPRSLLDGASARYPEVGFRFPEE
jgi:hypothetical protein